MTIDYRAIPSVETLLQTDMALALITEFGRPLAVEAIRQAVDDVRGMLKGEQLTTIPSVEAILKMTDKLLHDWFGATLRPVINATGVILHTNLGRAPLSDAAIKAMQGVAGAYSTLEFNLESGKRGSRYVHAEDLLKRITGAEAAMVVNNNAAALLLILAALARRRRVVIGRSQLIEIGGGFRIPEVMKQSGAKLVEVGATNKVHLADYEQAIKEQPIHLVLRAHRSNFKLIGFTSEPSLKELADLAHAYDLPFVDDLGSGTFLDTAVYGLGHEETVMESLGAGADLVCFSGDKLLGGPQAGIIVGKDDLVEKLRKHPMARAIRADKLGLAALAATLTHYLKDEAVAEIPVWQMIGMSQDAIKMRAVDWQIELMQHNVSTDVIAGESAVGGGSLPGETLPTWLLAISVKNAKRALAVLREANLPVIARVEDDRVLFDPRTVRVGQDEDLLAGIKQVFG